MECEEHFVIYYDLGVGTSDLVEKVPVFGGYDLNTRFKCLYNLARDFWVEEKESSN